MSVLFLTQCHNSLIFLSYRLQILHVSSWPPNHKIELILTGVSAITLCVIADTYNRYLQGGLYNNKLGTLNAVDFKGSGHFISGLHSPETKWPPPLKSTTFKGPMDYIIINLFLKVQCSDTPYIVKGVSYQDM